MKKNLLTLSITATFLTSTLLTGCGDKFTSLDAQDASSSSSNGAEQVEATPSSKMISELEANLRSGTVGTSSVNQKAVVSKIALPLSSAQINTILASAQAFINANGLANSSDMSAIISQVIAGASTGVGALNLKDPALISQLLSMIGNSTLTSLVNQSATTVSTTLLEQIANNVFANMNIAGLPVGNMSTAANTIINSIVSNLAATDLDASGFSGVLKSIAQGAVAGIGKLNLGSTTSSTILNTILSSLGAGSSSGITSLISSLGLSGSGASSMVSTLVNAFSTGAKAALQNYINSGKTSSTIGTLLSAVLNGLSGSAASNTNASGTTGVVSNIITSVVGSLLSNLIKN
jgi:hypothetical protein